MKTTIDHLPEDKQAKLRAITSIFTEPREGAPVGMLILFGSHARDGGSRLTLIRDAFEARQEPRTRDLELGVDRARDGDVLGTHASILPGPGPRSSRGRNSTTPERLVVDLRPLAARSRVGESRRERGRLGA